VSRGSSRLVFDGATLATALGAPGRRFRADPRCFAGEPVPGAYAHVCAQPDPTALLPYDAPEVQQARRDALAWWIPLLAERLVCLTTLALDAVNYGGAVTVATDPRLFDSDPFARIFPGTVVETDLFCPVPPPPGPAIERYSGVAWPGGAFARDQAHPRPLPAWDRPGRRPLEGRARGRAPHMGRCTVSRSIGARSRGRPSSS